MSLFSVGRCAVLCGCLVACSGAGSTSEGAPGDGGDGGDEASNEPGSGEDVRPGDAPNDPAPVTSEPTNEAGGGPPTDDGGATGGSAPAPVGPGGGAGPGSGGEPPQGGAGNTASAGAVGAAGQSGAAGMGGSSSLGTGGAVGAGGAAGVGGSPIVTEPALAPMGCDTPLYQDADFDVVYEVGPGREFETPSEVPWEAIGPGTLVKIFPRAEPYRDKWVLNVAGTEDAKVVVMGVAEDGVLPAISGDGATTRPELNFTGEERSIIKIGSSNVPDNERPSHIHIACLDLRNAKPGYTFTADDGSSSEYAENAATITIELGDHITITHSELHDAGNGLFSAHDTSDVVISGNHIHDNGNVDSIYEHNSYTEGSRITFEYNHYGPLCSGCSGNNLKDRSAGTVIRYNWIENGNRQLDLVETDYDTIASLPEYRATYVYGNVLIEGDGEGNSQILHYGGDGEGLYRAGTLYFFHNTVVSTRAGNTTLARLSTDEETLSAFDNVFFASAGGDRLAILDGSGTATLAGNWLPMGYRATHGTLTEEVVDLGNAVGGDPGFRDPPNQDFHLLADAGARGAAVALPAEVSSHPVSWQYLVHQALAPRSETLDPGAFEGED